MSYYSVEIDQERPEEEFACRSGQCSDDLHSQQSESAMSSIYSDDYSESTSLSEMPEDEDASYLTSMLQRRQPGLKQICEMPTDDVNAADEPEMTCEDPEEVVDKDTESEEKISSMTMKSASNKEPLKPSNSPNRKYILCGILIIALAITATLIVLLVKQTSSSSNTTSQSFMSNAQESMIDAPTSVPEVAISPNQPQQDTPAPGNSAVTRTPSAAPQKLSVEGYFPVTVGAAETNGPTLAPTDPPIGDDIDASAYLSELLSSDTQREFLLDASRPQGRAFLQLLEDHQNNFRDFPETHFLQSFAVLTLYYATSPDAWDTAFSWTDQTSDVCSWTGVVDCAEVENSQAVIGITLSSKFVLGTLPEEICLLEHLESLDLSFNMMSGVIPDCLRDLVSLKNIDLSNNFFSGDLPPGVLLIPSLEGFNVSGNSLTGGLDTLMGSMFLGSVYRTSETWKLRRLNLDSNHLSGKLPEYFQALLNLKSLTLHNNDLSGDVGNFCANSDLSELTADCREVACTCCTVCY